MAIFKTEEEVIAFIKQNQTVPAWVTAARDKNTKYKALVKGEKFIDHLISKIEKIENNDRAEARKKYAKDIKSLFSRVFEPRTNVFTAHGGSMDVDVKSQKLKEKIMSHVQTFKGNKSLHQFMSEHFFQQMDVDPNGVFFMEYVGDQSIYPTYKSIQNIRNYETEGQNLLWILFEPVKKKLGSRFVSVWRLVDEENNWTVVQDGQSFIVNGDKDKTFMHPFGQVPGVVLSDRFELGAETRLSPLFEIESESEDYARDKSILTVYKFLMGSPVHWRYTQQCRRCTGLGKTGDGKKCGACNGTGYMGKNDVTDMIELKMPGPDDVRIAPDIAGFVSPDLTTWQQYKEDLKDTEELMISTIWGTDRFRQGGNETATGRWIDVQPVINRLDRYADNAEWVMNELLEMLVKWADKADTKASVRVSLGRSFVIESSEVLLERYMTARKDGASATVLDRLLREYISSKYKNNPERLQNELNKAILEPHVHLSIKEVSDIYGPDEAKKKEDFSWFWMTVDRSLPLPELKKKFSTFVV